MIEGWEWIIVAAYVLTTGVGTYLILSVQGDIRMDERWGENDDEQAAKDMIKMLGASESELIIHDDGNGSSSSVYNNERVLEAMKKRLRECPSLRIRCLFNDDAQLKILDLAKSEPGKVEIWHVKGPRPQHDIHYKVVDNGKMVHMSFHDHGATERKYMIREPPRWARGTQRRICRVRRKHFETGVRDATRVV